MFVVHIYILFMRIVLEIPGEQVKTTVFEWNEKYLIKFEAGNYEQTYKVSRFEVANDEAIKQLVADEEFQAAWIKQFQAMHQSLGNALQKI
jgi:hypothetical protein